MKSQEAAIYREIQKETDMAIKAIDTISDKVYDENFSRQITRQSLQYSRLHDEATRALLDGGAEGYHSNRLADMAQRTGIQYNTLLNTSTGHIAELMIRGSNNSVLQMEKALRHNEGAGEAPKTLAKELLAFEQNSIKELKDYL